MLEDEQDDCLEGDIECCGGFEQGDYFWCLGCCFCGYWIEEGVESEEFCD